MHVQRIVVSVVAALGMACVFLPWVIVSFGEISMIQIGWSLGEEKLPITKIIFALYAFVLTMALLGNWKSHIAIFQRIGSAICCALASGVCILILYGYYSQINKGGMEAEVARKMASIGLGFFVSAAAGILILLLMFALAGKSKPSEETEDQVEVEERSITSMTAWTALALGAVGFLCWLTIFIARLAEMDVSWLTNPVHILGQVGLILGILGVTSGAMALLVIYSDKTRRGFLLSLAGLLIGLGAVVPTVLLLRGVHAEYLAFANKLEALGKGKGLAEGEEFSKAEEKALESMFKSALTSELNRKPSELSIEKIGQLPSPGSAVPPNEPVQDADSGQDLYGLSRARLKGHGGTPDALAISPDGQILASADSGNIWLWTLADGKPAVKISGLGKYTKVDSIRFSPDGKLLATSDSVIRLWEIPSGNQIRVLKDDKSGSPSAIDISPDGKTLAAIHSGGNVLLWNISDGSLLAKHEKLLGSVYTNWIDFSPDGKILAAAAENKTALVFDSESGQVLHRLKGHKDDVSSLDFSPDGKTLVTIADGDAIRLWDPTTGKEMKTIENKMSMQHDVAFSPSGKTLAVGGKGIKLWDTQTGKLRADLEDIRGSVARLAFSPDGNVLGAVTYEDRDILLWDLEMSRQKKTIPHDGKMEILAASPDGKNFALAGKKIIEIRSVDTGDVVHKMTTAENVKHLAFSPDGKILAVAGEEPSLWDVESGKKLGDLKTDLYRVNCIAFSSDGATLAGGGREKIQLWDLATRAPTLEMGKIRGSVKSVAFSSVGQVFAAGDSKSFVHLWKPGKRVPGWLAQEKGVGALALSPDGKWLATSGGDGDHIARVWEVATGKQQAVLPGHTDDIKDVAFSSDNTKVVTASQDKTIRIWEAKTGRQLAALYGHTEQIDAVEFIGDTGIFVSLSQKDKSIRLWDLATVAEPSAAEGIGIVRNQSPDGDAKTPAVAIPAKTFEGSTESISSLAFSADGRRLACGGFDNTVYVWDTESKKLLHTLTGHTQHVETVALSPDGSLAASGAMEKVLHVWNLQTGKEKWSKVPHAERVNSVAFSTDGKILASAGFEAQIKLWDAATGKAIRQLDGDNNIRVLVFSPDKRILAAGGDDVTLWDYNTGKKLRKIDTSEYVEAIAFSPDGKTLAAAGGTLYDSDITVWDVATGKKIRLLSGHREPIRWLSISPDGKTLASTGMTTKLWDLNTGKLLWDSRGNRTPKMICFSPDGKFLAARHDKVVSFFSVDQLLDEDYQRSAAQLLAAGAEFSRPGDQLLIKMPVNGLTSSNALARLQEIKDPFTLDMRGSDSLTDVAIGQLATLESLRGLKMSYCDGFNDNQLKQLHTLVHLEELDISSNNGITDAAMQTVGSFSRLRKLMIRRTEVTDRGLIHLKGLSQLNFLGLGSLSLSAEGMENLSALTELTELDLSYSSLKDDDTLVHLKSLANLQKLNLDDAEVTDAGLVHLNGLTNLQVLNLGSTDVTDAGLVHLNGLTKLQQLDLDDTKVTDAGLVHLKDLVEIKNLILPEEITDTGFAHLANMTKLEEINYSSLKKLTGAGFGHLKNAPAITVLNLTWMKTITDEGLKGVGAMTQLKILKLPKSITDAGLAHLKGLKNLTELDLDGASVTDAGVAHLKELSLLNELSLSKTKITDAGLDHLKGLSKLQTLHVGDTKVTDKGIESFKKAIPDVSVWKF